MTSGHNDVEVIAVNVSGFGEALNQFNRSLESTLALAVNNTPERFRIEMTKLFESLYNGPIIDADVSGTAYRWSLYVQILDAILMDADARVCERRIKISEDDIYALLVDPDGPLKFTEVGHTCGSTTEADAILRHSRNMASWTAVDSCPGCIILKFIDNWLQPLMRAVERICIELNRVGVFGQDGWVRIVGSFNDTVYIADYLDAC